MTLNNWQKGKIAELAVARRAIELGFEVFTPTSSHLRFDLLLYKDNQYIRAQVKHGSLDNNIINVSFAKSRWDKHKEGYQRVSTYTQEDCDVIIVFNPDTESCYWIPPAKFLNTQSIALRTEHVANNQSKGINYAFDYLW